MNVALATIIYLLFYGVYSWFVAILLAYQFSVRMICYFSRSYLFRHTHIHSLLSCFFFAIHSMWSLSNICVQMNICSLANGFHAIKLYDRFPVCLSVCPFMFQWSLNIPNIIDEKRKPLDSSFVALSTQACWFRVEFGLISYVRIFCSCSHRQTNQNEQRQRKNANEKTQEKRLT